MNPQCLAMSKVVSAAAGLTRLCRPVMAFPCNPAIDKYVIREMAGCCGQFSSGMVRDSLTSRPDHDKPSLRLAAHHFGKLGPVLPCPCGWIWTFWALWATWINIITAIAQGNVGSHQFHITISTPVLRLCYGKSQVQPITGLHFNG